MCNDLRSDRNSFCIPKGACIHSMYAAMGGGGGLAFAYYFVQRGRGVRIPFSILLISLSQIVNTQAGQLNWSCGSRHDLIVKYLIQYGSMYLYYFKTHC